MVSEVSLGLILLWPENEVELRLFGIRRGEDHLGPALLLLYSFPVHC